MKPGPLPLAMLIVGTLIAAFGVLAGLLFNREVAGWFVFGVLNMLLYETISLRMAVQSLRQDADDE